MEQNGTQKNKTLLSCINCDYKCSDIIDFNIHLNTMEHKKSRKSRKSIVSNKFICCVNCNYNCSSQSELNRHFDTTKHMNQGLVKQYNEYSCECGKTYMVKSGLWKHKQLCSFVIRPTANCNPVPYIMDIISQNKDIVDLLVLQNEELKRQNKEQSDTIRELIPKIGNNNVITTTNNNQFNIQNFLNEDYRDALNFSDFIKQIQVSLADLENQAENGYIKGITNLFIKNLQGLGMNKRPIYCTDKKRKTLYIKENDEWDKEGSQDILKKGIQEVTRRTFQQLIKEQKIHSEEYNDADSEFSTNAFLSREI